MLAEFVTHDKWIHESDCLAFDYELGFQRIVSNLVFGDLYKNEKFYAKPKKSADLANFENSSFCCFGLKCQKVLFANGFES